MIRRSSSSTAPSNHTEQLPVTSKGTMSIVTGSDYEEDIASIHSTSTSGVHDALGNNALEIEERKNLARTENKAVYRIRVAVYLVVMVAAVAVALGAHFFVKAGQRTDFENQFQSYASKLQESFMTSVEQRLGAISTMSATVTSYARDSGSSFPNVTIPDFEVRGSHARIQADAVMMYWLPLVTDETRNGWEDYAVNHRNWLQTGYELDRNFAVAQDLHFGYSDYAQRRNLERLPDGYSKSIFGIGGELPEGSGPYFPLWQLSPVLPVLNTLNFNVLDMDSMKNALNKTYETHQVVLGEAHDLFDPNDAEAESKSIYSQFLHAGQYRHDVDSYQGDPTTSMIYPVFDSFGYNRSLAGVLTADIYWRKNFVDILPEQAQGVIAVLENTLGQSFSYRIDGSNVTYLGPSDLHESDFDRMAVSQDLTAKILERASPENEGFGSASFNPDYCHYTLRVYPSRAMEHKFTGILPAVLPGLIVIIFVLTSIIFIVYDRVVERRQKVVLERAVASSAIVSSLYPKQVRERLFQEESDDPMKTGWESSKKKDTSSEELGKDYFESGSDIIQSSRPIADIYEGTTIMFADLAGFTAWSATKTPEEVFILLETLYQAFDKIALKCKVFKVETIGDCYVAVAGLPSPQPGHAVIMAKFARACQTKMRQLLMVLKEELGEETADLSFRVGLHSGPVTGGVLRGQKSRFQLFGCTMNTASRMESNGVPGRIHVSQTTADELTKYGKGHWVSPREDMITAKGLGELQTYFVNMAEAKSASSPSTNNSYDSDEERMGENDAEQMEA